MYKLLNKKLILFAISVLFIKTIQGKKARTIGPSDEELLEIISIIENSTQIFAVKLNKILYQHHKQHENVIFSPYAIVISLAMLQLGVHGVTHFEIKKMLGHPQSDTTEEVIQLAYLFMLFDILNAGRTQLRFVNRLFAPNEAFLRAKYLRKAEKYHMAKSKQLPILQNPRGATNEINRLVFKATEKTIYRVIPHIIDSNTQLIITPILYYNALWEDEFNASNTREDIFHTNLGKTTIRMMTNEALTGYVNLPSIKAESISLKMFGNNTIIHFVLPYPNQTLENVIQSFSKETFDEIRLNTKNAQVKYKIPHMTLQWTDDVATPVRSLGINRIFTFDAELRDIVANTKTKVSMIAHSVFLKVDEKGFGNGKPIDKTPIAVSVENITSSEEESFSFENSEYNALPYMNETIKNTTQQPTTEETQTEIEEEEILSVEFNLNRPFLFFIKKPDSNATLFLGSVNNPNGNKK